MSGKYGIIHFQPKLGGSHAGIQFIVDDAKYMINLKFLYLENYKIDKPFDIGYVRNYQILANFDCSFTEIEGDFSAIKESQSKKYFFGKYNKVIPCDISDFPQYSLYSTASNTSSMAAFSWGHRNANKRVLALMNIRLDNNIDAMLIDQASLNNISTYGTNPWENEINVFGTRTSASDAAVATLKGAGWHIRINNEEI